MEQFKHDGVTFHYEVLGEGYPLIFLHGLGGSIDQVKNTYQMIKGIQLVVIDQRGHGETEFSNWSEANFDMFGNDVIALADHLGLKQFYLAGISMGAAVSINIALRYQERVKGLCLIRIAWLDHKMETEVMSWFSLCEKYLHDSDGKTKFMKEKSYLKLLEEAPRSAASFVNFFDDEVAKKQPIKFQVIPHWYPFSSLEDLYKLDLPVLILSNQYDPIHPFSYGAQYRAHIPHATAYEITSKTIDVVRHEEEINKYLRAFLEEN